MKENDKIKQIAIDGIVQPGQFKNLPSQPIYAPNPNNFAVAIELYKKLAKILDTFSKMYQTPKGYTELNFERLDESYILICDILQDMYFHYSELEKIDGAYILTDYKTITGNENDIYEKWSYYADEKEAYNKHLGLLRREWVLNGKQEAIIDDSLKQILTEADEAILDFETRLEKEVEHQKSTMSPDELPIDTSIISDIILGNDTGSKPNADENKIYMIEHKPNGQILVNGIYLSKTNASSTADDLMMQAFENEGTTFKPKNIGSRTPSSLLNDKGIKGAIKKAFFPKVSKNGIFFRSQISEKDLVAENVDIDELDEMISNNKKQ